jgi:endoglucanase
MRSILAILALTSFAAAQDAGPPMKPIVERDTPAHVAAKKFLRGVNLANYLEAPLGQDWGGHYGEADFPLIRGEGFDHVRIPVGWQNYAGPAPDFKLPESIFKRVDALTAPALKNGLAVMINVHHFDAFTKDPKAQKEKFLAIWRQVAEHYAGAPETVAFELLNEPKDAATTVVMNPIYAEAITRIRKSNPKRTIFLGPGKWNQSSELVNLRLPDDRNLIVTVHCYDLFFFTHQGATWAGPEAKAMVGVRFPGPPKEQLVVPADVKLAGWAKDFLKRYNTLPGDENPCSAKAIRKPLHVAGEWSKTYGRPVHIGEFGCFTKADPESRARWHQAFREALDAEQLGWCLWDWTAGFRYWDPKMNTPMPGLREALFPKAGR